MSGTSAGDKAKTFGWLWLACMIATVSLVVHSSRLLVGSGIVHDNLALSFPLRVLFSTAIQNDVLPLWSYLTEGGGPFHTLYSNHAMSPLVWMLSVFGIYTLNTFVFEIILLLMAGFTGMYVWLRPYGGRWGALVGAVAFTLSMPVLIQTPVNLEGVAGAFFYPWVMVGCRAIAGGRREGIVYLAAALFWMFAVGYLGTNVIAIQFLFVLALYMLAMEQGSLADKRRRIGFAVAAVCLFLVAYSLPIAETLTQLSVDYFTKRPTNIEFQPFAASSRLSSFFSFVFPNKVSAFETDDFSGHAMLLYISLPMLYLALHSLWYGRRERIVLLIFALTLLMYFAASSPQHAIGPALTAVIPLLKSIRFHCWHMILIVFFVVTLAAIGFRQFVEQKDARKKWLSLAAFTAFAVAAAVARDESLFTLVTSSRQFAVALLFVPLLVLTWLKPAAGRWQCAVLLAFVLSDLAVVATTDLIPFPQAQTRSREEFAADIRKMSVDEFPVVSNTRATRPLGFFAHYFTKTPVATGYYPMLHPVMLRHRLRPDHEVVLRQILSVAASDQGTMQVESLVLDTESVTAALVADRALTVVWTSAYSTSWRLTVDGQRQPLAATDDGLSRFSLPQGRHDVRLVYRPWYMPWVLGLTVLTALCLSGMAVRFGWKQRSQLFA